MSTLAITTNPYELSPYIIFLIPALAIYLNLLSKVFPYFTPIIYHLRIKRLPAPFFETSYGGFFLILAYIGLNIAVGVTTYYGEYIASVVDDDYSMVSNLLMYQDAMVTVTGVITMMNYWMIFLPTSKTSLLSYLTGLPFERTVKYHKLIVYVTIVSGLTHLIYNYKVNYIIFYTSDSQDDDGQGAGIRPLYGFIAFILTCGMIIVSSDYFQLRKYNYELFMRFHHINGVIALFIILHYSDALPGFIPGFLLHGIDRLFKLKSWILKDNVIKITAQEEITTITMKTNCIDSYFIKPGSYYFINISQISLTEWHPFSMSNYNIQNNEITFNIKSLNPNSFTNKLYNYVSDSKNTPNLSISTYGPFGNLSINIERYQTLYLFAAGIGITPMLPIIDIISGINGYRCTKLNKLSLIWSLRNPFLFSNVFNERLSFTNDIERKCSNNNNEFITLNNNNNNLNFEYNIFNTAIKGNNEDSLTQEFNYSTNNEKIPIKLRKCLGRPNIRKLFEQIGKLNHKVGIIICGPAEYSNSILKEAEKYSNIDIHMETFGY